LAHYQRALEAAERDGHKVQMAMAHANLGIQSYLGGRLAPAREHLERALALFGESAGEQRLVNTYRHLGRLSLVEGDLARAHQCIETGLALAAEGQERWGADCLDVLGTLASLRGDWDTAEASFARALQVHRASGFLAGAVESLVGLGLVDQHRGLWAQALARFREAAGIAGAMEPGPTTALAGRHLGRLLLLTGRLDEARRVLRAVLDHDEAVRQTLEYGPTLLVAAELRAAGGDHAGALDLAGGALAAGGTAEHLVQAHLVLASLTRAAGDLAAAGVHGEEARALAERMGAPRLLSLAQHAGETVATEAGDDQGVATRAPGWLAS
jgi:tetratricopeptide (TPR) repeat protein